MSTSINIAHADAAARFTVANLGGNSGPADTVMDEGLLHRASTIFNGALIVSAVTYVTITWALQAVARFN